MLELTIGGVSVGDVESMSTRRRRRFVFQCSQQAIEGDCEGFAHILDTDTDDRVRANAVRGIAHTGHPQAPVLLPSAAQTGSRRLRTSALWMLIGKAREDQVQALSRLLADDDRAIRSLAVQVLAKLDPKVAVPVVVPALGDPSRSVRFRAAEALGSLGDPSAIPALDEAIAREHGFNRSSMRRVRTELAAIGRSGPEEA